MQSLCHRLPNRLSPLTAGSYPESATTGPVVARQAGSARIMLHTVSSSGQPGSGTSRTQGWSGAWWGCRWEGNVPLSEHEQRVLEQIERALYADDPKFAATVRGIDPRTLHRRRYLRAALGAIIGVVLLPVGIAVEQLELSVAGFVLMLLAFLYGASTWRQGREATEVSEPGRVGEPPICGLPVAGAARSSARRPRPSAASSSVSRSAGTAVATVLAAGLPARTTTASPASSTTR